MRTIKLISTNVIAFGGAGPILGGLVNPILLVLFPMLYSVGFPSAVIAAILYSVVLLVIFQVTKMFDPPLDRTRCHVWGAIFGGLCGLPAGLPGFIAGGLLGAGLTPAHVRRWHGIENSSPLNAIVRKILISLVCVLFIVGLLIQIKGGVAARLEWYKAVGRFTGIEHPAIKKGLILKVDGSGKSEWKINE